MTEKAVTETPAQIPTEDETQKIVLTEKDKAILKALDNLKEKFENEDQIRSFFTKRTLEKYWYVNFEEFEEIFGHPLEGDALGKIKKYWAEKEVSYFNISYDLLWPIKWAPVAIKYVSGLVRFRVMSMALLFVYLEAVDFFLQPMILHYYKRRRIFRVSEAFDYHLTKPKYEEMRWEWFENYINVIKRCIMSGVQLGPDKDKKLIKLMNKESVDDKLFQSFDNVDTSKSKEILWKKEIDAIKSGRIGNYVNSLSLGKTIRTYLTSWKNLYFDYKRNFEDFPKRKDFEVALDPKYFPIERRISFKEELSEKTRTVARTIDYAIGSPRVQGFLVDSGILEAEVPNRREKLKLGMKNNLADFVIFSVIFLVPFKGVRMIKQWAKFAPQLSKSLKKQQ